MKFAFTADIHLSSYSQDKPESETNLPERLHSIKNTLYEMATHCVQNDIRVIVIGGDILHGKSIIYAIAQEIMIQFFEDFGEKILFYVIDGNHDLSGKGESVVSALRPLEKINNVNWVRFDQTLHLKEEDMLFVPYSKGMVDIIKNNRAKILISHFGLSEGILNSGLSIVSDISLKDLAGKYQMVLLGHYHKPQEILNEQIRLLYAGSTIQLDWGEKGDEKRFLIVDSDTLHVDYIPFTTYRKHLEIELTEDNKDDVLKAAQAARESGDHVKIIKRDHVDTSALKEFNIIDKSEVDITARGITSNMSMEDKLKRFLTIKEIPEDKHELYLEVAMELVRKGDESII
jgi:DNA repair exonuclease SbcCD nuclease subunit